MYIMVLKIKLYESVHPWRTENLDLKSRMKIVTTELNKCKTDYNRHIDVSRVLYIIVCCFCIYFIVFSVLFYYIYR